MTASAPQQLTLALGIASGMAYLHGFTSADGRRTPILHLDLKPANVLLGRDGTPLISDFGLSVEAARGVHVWRAGTALCRAPEVMLRDACVSGRADTWSYGCLLVCLVTGAENAFGLVPPAGWREDPALKKAFTDEVAGVEREVRLAGRVPSLADFKLESPSQLANVIKACVKSDPSKRPSFSAIWDVIMPMCPKRKE